MPTETATQEIKGLPAGAVVEPIEQSATQIKGLPAGAVVEPITQAAPQAAAPIKGLPPQAVVEPFKPPTEVNPFDLGMPAKVPDLNKKPVQPPKGQATMGAAKLSAWDKAKIAFTTSDTGKTLANNWDDLKRTVSNTFQGFMGNDPERKTNIESLNKQADEFLNKHVPESLTFNGLLNPEQGKVASQLVRGGAKGGLQFAESMYEPDQIMLMAGTLGESSLIGLAAKTGKPMMVTAARTLGGLIQAQFTAQMIEGGYTGVRDSLKAAMKGDWESAAEAGVNGMISLLMARGIMDHTQANERVYSDLNQKSREMHGTSFDHLTPENQGLVIDATVKASPEYSAMLNDIQAKNEKAEQSIRQKQGRKLAKYEGLAYENAWNPDASRRAVDITNFVKRRDADVAASKSRVNDFSQRLSKHIADRAAEIEKSRALDEEANRYFKSQDELDAEANRYFKEQDKRDVEANRALKGIEKAEKRTPIVQSAQQIAEGRTETRKQRAQTANIPTPEETWRPVDTQVSNDGHVNYVGTYIDQPAQHGVAVEGNNHSIYRQTGDRTEWLDSSGIFVPEPSELFTTDNPETADAIARISSVATTADTLAEMTEAPPEALEDSNQLDELRKQLVSGEITPEEAKRKAGIAQVPEISDEFRAAQDGNLGGPFVDSSPSKFASDFENALRESGASDAEIRASLETLPEIVRAQTENNLHHIQHTGDYITSKKGVKWILDSKGMLHPENGGAAVPLMKRGNYSSQARRLAASGKIGYGHEDYETRAAREQWEKVGNAAVERVDFALGKAPFGFGEQPEDETAQRRLNFEEKREVRRFPPPPGREESKSEFKSPYKGKYDKTFADVILALDNLRHGDIEKYLRSPEKTIDAFLKAAEEAGVSVDSLVRLKLMRDGAEPLRRTIAGLEAGDEISDAFHPDRPWVVRQRNGEFYLQAGDARLPLNRINPSERVQQIVRRGELKTASRWVPEAEYQPPAYEEHQKELADEVRRRMQDKDKGPEPRTKKQVAAQIEVAERRTNATESIATRELTQALNPTTENVDEAEAQTAKAEDSIKLAEEAYAQEVEAKGKETPEDAFPQRPPVSIGYRGAAGTIVQNNREFPFHYELLPISVLTPSHRWEGSVMVPRENYPSALQPRTVSEAESRLNAMRAERGTYDIRQLMDKTINATMGPPIVERGGFVPGGNTRLNILIRHIENIESISDPEEKQAAISGLRSIIRTWAQESGINSFPGNDDWHVVTRMLDKPIETMREAADLGRLFNKSVGVQITQSAKGISYSKSLDADMLDRIGQRVESNDGIIPAMEKDPEFFRDIAVDKFGVMPEEYADWFNTDEKGNPTSLNDQGRSQFIKALLGTVVKDTSTLNRIEGKTAYRALARGLNYVLQMKAIPDRDITEKILEAVQAAADTQGVDPILHSSHDVWKATYQREQGQLMGMETEQLPEPDRMVEAIWRALHASDVASPRAFSDRLKQFIGEESSEGWLAGATTNKVEQPYEAFNRAFQRQLREVAQSRGDRTEGLTKEEYEAALRNREMGEQETGRERRRPETQALRKRIDQMSSEEKTQALLTSRKTGLPNMIDFEEHNDPELGGRPAPIIGRSDIDGLKAFNDLYGYEAGDKLLKAKADALRSVGVEAYHDKGDEFVYRADSVVKLVSQLAKAREILQNTPIEVKDKNGKIIIYKGVDFSFGVGHDLDEAEEGQHAAKAERKTKRGEMSAKAEGIEPPPFAKQPTPDEIDAAIYAQAKRNALARGVNPDDTEAWGAEIAEQEKHIRMGLEGKGRVLPVPYQKPDGTWYVIDGRNGNYLKSAKNEADAKAIVAQMDEVHEKYRTAFEKGTKEGIVPPPVASSRKRELTDKEYDALSEEARALAAKRDKLAKQIMKPGGMVPPPITAELNTKRAAEMDKIDKRLDEINRLKRASAEVETKSAAETGFDEVKESQGYVTSGQLLSFLQDHPATSDHAPELMRTAQMMAEYVYDADPPEGVSRKEALDWILKERLAGVEKGTLKTKRGEYSDPNLDRELGTRIMKLHQAADATSFLHEFAHVIFPFLSDQDLAAIDSIGEKKVWDGKAASLKGDVYARMSEKLAGGMERFLRDQNPRDFTSEVKSVLGKVKEIFRKVYLAFKKDPLAPFTLSSDAVEMFDNMFHIAGSDVPDVWREEVKKAHAAEKKLVKPEEQVHPLAALARDIGATEVADTIDGKVEDEIGDRVDPNKNTVVLKGSEEQIRAAFANPDLNEKYGGLQLIKGNDGEWGIRFNTKEKIDKSKLYQALPQKDIERISRGQFEVTPVDKSRDEDARFIFEDGRVLYTRENHAEVARQVIGSENTDKYMRGAKAVRVVKVEPGDMAFEPDAAPFYFEMIRKPNDAQLKAMSDLVDGQDFSYDIWKGGRIISSDNRLPQTIGRMRVHLDQLFKEKGSVEDQGRLFQELPERHPGLQLEDLEAKLKAMPAYMVAQRKLLELQIKNIKNRIRADHGVEERKPESVVEVAKQAAEEVKHAKADEARTRPDGVPGVQDVKRTGGIPKPPDAGRSERAGTGRGTAKASQRASESAISLENVKPVTLQPMMRERGASVGLTTSHTFDHSEWQDSLRKGGLPDNLPPPTWALDPKTAAQLIYPGQKQIVQTALSAIEQGDGVTIVSPPGTGKTYTSSAIAKEFMLRNPDANILYISKNRKLYKKFQRVASNTFGLDVQTDKLDEKSPNGIYTTSYAGTLNDDIFKNKHWDLVLADESGEARRYYDESTQQGEMLRKVIANADKAVYLSATPFHSPAEYGYLDKLNLWPKGRYGRWLAENFKHRIVNGEVVAELDPAKQAKLREQLIQRGQLIPQEISYEGYTAHFGVVPITHDMERGLNRIRVGFDRARQTFEAMGKKGLARKVSAFEAVYTKNYLERSRMPQAIEIAKRAVDQGYQVLVFSEHTADDLFRRERMEGEDPSTYQQLDDAMGGGLSRVIPPYASVFNELQAEFGDIVGDYSGRGNTDAARERALTDFLKGDSRMLYTSYAGGGIGVDMHDGDYPDLDIKGGDKPRVAIYLGPPYSGVLLEQAMGRPWRFGTKSNVIAVFLGSDAEPEIRLMQTKIGPRMRALRAAVIGEKDSLADVMSHYTDEDKIRERQEQLAYSQGNEVKMNATDLVAKRGRRVGINSWDNIHFPSAEEAKNKGMKYGDKVTGGDWSTLYQDTESLWKLPPPTPETIEGARVIDAVGNGIAAGEVPPPLQNLDPAERDATVGAAAAMASEEVALGGNRDAENVAKSTMKWGLNIPKEMELRYEKRKKGRWPFQKTVDKAVWVFPEGVEPANRPIGPPEGEPYDVHTRYIGWGSMKGGIEAIARQAGTPDIGLNLTRMIGSWQRDVDMIESQFRWYARNIFEENGIDWRKEPNVAKVMAVAEGAEVSSDAAINKTAQQMREWFDKASDASVKEGVKMKNAKTGRWEPFKPLKNYWTHIIDWKAEVEYREPHSGEMKKVPLREAMRHTFPQDQRAEIMRRLAKAAKWSDGEPVSSYDLDRYLRQKYRKGTPIQPNVQTERTINFPIVRKDFDVVTNYAGQLARAIATERYFGSDRGKLLQEISKIPSTNGRRDITLMFDTMLSPQEFSKRWMAFSNAMTGFTALSKMTLSFAKVPFHAVHMVYPMHGDPRAMIRGLADTLIHPSREREEAIFIGTLARQVDFTGVTDEGKRKGPSHLMFEVTGFNTAYNVGRVWASATARNWMEHYAIKGLKDGGTAGEEYRRMLKNNMLLSDSVIDAAKAKGEFTRQDIQKAQVAFANEVMFTDNPLEMPQWAREHIGRDTSGQVANLYRFMRLAYSMASFTVKTRALLRKHVIDEAFRYGNWKMIPFAAAFEPLVGAAVWSISAGIKTGIQKSLEQATGQKHQPNALDKEKEEFEKAIWGPAGPKKLAQDVELYIDLVTAGIAQEQIKLLGDMILNVAADPKKAKQEAMFYGGDVLENVIGPIWTSTIVKPLEWGKREIDILAGRSRNKGAKTLHSTAKTIFEEFPISRNIPQIQKLTKPPK